MLKEFVIHAINGLCNRFRLIASCLMIANHYQVRLKVVFTEDDLGSLIHLPGNIDVLRSSPDLTGFTRLKEKGNNYFHDLSSIEKVYIESCYVINEVSLPPFDLAMLPEIIIPSEAVMKRVDELRMELRVPDQYIGMHIRRGDHRRCRRFVPDEMVFDEVRKIVSQDSNRSILLACEDVVLREAIQRMFSERVIIATRKKTYWQNRMRPGSCIDDYAELLLLSKADYVVGTWWSSYSGMMKACNGNSSSYLLGTPTGKV